MRVLQGKAIIVTGGAKGLGAAYGLFCAREGAFVVLNDIDCEALSATVNEIAADPIVNEAGGTAIGFEGDIVDWTVANNLVDHCVDRFGKLDGLINNAGVFYVADPDEETEDRFRRIMEVNVLGAAWCSLSALRQMKRQGFGSIVNVSSGAQAGLVGRAAYGGSKGALTAMTYAWAVDMKPFGVRVNAVSPIGTTAMSDASHEYALSKGRAHQRIIVDPMENGPIVAFLLSDDAKEITGQYIRTEYGEMSLLCHTAVLRPSVKKEKWTVDDVREVFATDFAKRSFPLGLVAIETEVYPVK